MTELHPVPVESEQDFSLVLRVSLRDESILTARSRLAELEEEAEERGFFVEVRDDEGSAS